jgi:hypothetical protein
MASEKTNQVKSGESALLSSWLHTDQTKLKSKCLHHIQGGLALTKLGPAEQRTQLVVPEGETMQSFRDRFLKAFPPIADGDATAEWVRHTSEERKWLLENGRVVAPTLEPGEMILWDSGMPHASIPGLLAEGQATRGVRMSAFVSMHPIDLLQDADLAVRRAMLDKGNTSGHRVTAEGKHKPFLECKFPFMGRTYGKEMPAFKTDRRLGGFKRTYEAYAADEPPECEVTRKTAELCGGYGYVRAKGLKRSLGA